MAMEWIELLNWLLGLLTIIAGGGWFINWKANKRKSNAEATQEEADGWAKQQDVYQQTIADMQKFNDMYRTYNATLIEENSTLRKNYDDLMKRMDSHQREIARLGRRLDCLSPFLCGAVGCMRRKKVSLMENIDDNSFDTVEERNDLKNEKEAGV